MISLAKSQEKFRSLDDGEYIVLPGGPFLNSERAKAIDLGPIDGQNNSGAKLLQEDEKHEDENENSSNEFKQPVLDIPKIKPLHTLPPLQSITSS